MKSFIEEIIAEDKAGLLAYDALVEASNQGADGNPELYAAINAVKSITDSFYSEEMISSLISQCVQLGVEYTLRQIERERNF